MDTVGCSNRTIGPCQDFELTSNSVKNNSQISRIIRKKNQKDNIIKKNRAKVEKHNGATTAALGRKKKHTKTKQHLEEKNMGR